MSCPPPGYLAGLVCLLALAGCAGSDAQTTPVLTTVAAPTVTVTAPPVTREVTDTITVTATVTSERTVTERIRVEPSGPRDVTTFYVSWRRTHHGSNADDAEQHKLVISATLESGVLNVLTSMRVGWGGWNCDGEPPTIDGTPVRYVRILYTDGSAFRSCSVR